MPSIISHAVAAVALGTAARPESHVPARYWIISAICSALPDLDVLAFGVGIPYGHMLGHRGLSHSLLFAALVGVAVPALAFRGAVPTRTRAQLAIWFFIATASHGVLDAMTNGGAGVAFFAPFSNERYFFPWRPIEVSPIGVVRFFSARGAIVLASESRWIWLPSAILAAAAWWLKRRRGLRTAQPVA
jgi:inner membrane protein